ncbi:uncharacterized protein ATC70_004471 [Mucor velutinosus]|uniref:DNA repair protein RAD51 homolog 3 n=1 Tax=Mucor velutinosus TaxID=708070 RepID=A0AAN7I4M4_9FUNG|nr:hypothetical protein ATC70_004471 [Mucor velutinosus]
MSLSKVIKLPSLLQKLEESGYETLDEVKRECISSLTKELELNKEEIKAVGKLGAKDKTKTIKIDESLTMEIESSFTTAVKNFDRLFVYGISPKKITEICGESGTGKTQLCLQMAVTIQLPKNQGGSEGECVYIDTEGSFNALRVQKMAERFGLEDPLKKIHVFRVLSHTEFVAIIMQLMEILTNRTKVKLVIIDSIAYHLRVNALPFRARIDFLNFAGPHLIKIAQNLTVSIVVTNHVTTGGVNDQWTPSLGNEWGNWCANRLFLYRKREFRYGYLYKSVEEIHNIESVQFCIKEKGLFDPENDEVQVAFKKENNVQPISSSQQQYDDLLQGDELEIMAFENELKKIKEQQKQDGLEGNGVDNSVSRKRTAEEASDPDQYINDYLSEHCTKATKHGTQLDVHSQHTYESNHNTSNVHNQHTPRISDETPTFMPSSQRFFSIPETAIVHNVTTTTTIPDENPNTTGNDNQAENDQVVEESNPWASDGEEEWDLDFLTNIQNYF